MTLYYFMITLKTKSQVEQIKLNGQILRDAVDKAVEASRPGVSTAELDKIIEQHILSCGATPTFKGYGGAKDRPAFPKTSCISVNSVLVHGIPSQKEKLQDGDLVSIDIGVTKNNCIADSCYSYAVGKLKPEHQKLLEAAKEITMYGISICRPGLRIHDLSRMVAEKAESLGFINMPGLFGHGTGGPILHEKPTIPFDRPPFKEPIPNPRLEKDMVITIEPVVAFLSSKGKYIEDPDYWTLRTIDGSWSAQFEHTILITDLGSEILTGTFK